MSSDRTVSSKPQPEPTPAQQAETIRNALQALTDYVDESPDVFIDTELAKRISVARAALRAASVSAEAAQQAETLEQAEILERLSRSQYLRDHVTGPHDTIEALRAGAAALRAAPVRYCDDARLVGGTGGWFYDVVTPDGTILASIPAAALRAAVPMKQCSNGCAPHESCPQCRAAVSPQAQEIQSLMPLLLALEKDFETEAEDHEPVGSGMDGPCALTFGMIRQLRKVVEGSSVRVRAAVSGEGTTDSAGLKSPSQADSVAPQEDSQ